MNDADWPLFGRDHCIATELQLRDLSVPTTTEVHRLVYEPTWSAPYVITIECTGEAASVTARQSDGVGGYFSGVVVNAGTRALSSREWARFNKSINADWFRKLPLDDHKEYLDGHSYIFESRSRDSYHKVIRTCPEDVRFARFRKVNRLIQHFHRLSPIPISNACYHWQKDKRQARIDWHQRLGVPDQEAS